MSQFLLRTMWLEQQTRVISMSVAMTMSLTKIINKKMFMNKSSTALTLLLKATTLPYLLMARRDRVRHIRYLGTTLLRKTL